VSRDDRLDSVPLPPPELDWLSPLSTLSRDIMSDVEYGRRLPEVRDRIGGFSPAALVRTPGVETGRRLCR